MTRFTEEQMVKILRDADQSSVADVAKKHGVSEAMIYGGASGTASWMRST